MENILTISEFLERDLKKFTKEQLYDAVRIYLEARIKAKENSRDLEGMAYEVFAICEKEIIEREMRESEKLPYEQQKRSEYLVGFGSLLVKAGIITKEPYEVTLLN